MLHANVTGLRLAPNASSLDHLDVATLSGRHFTVKPKYAVVALGGIENARLLLASNDVMKPGIGNANDLVGRFFADHPIPGETATIVVFNGNIAPYYQRPYNANPTRSSVPHSRPPIASSAHNRAGRARHHRKRDPARRAGPGGGRDNGRRSSASMRARCVPITLGCGIEVAPDPDRRLTLTAERDQLGMPRLKLDMRARDADFARYRRMHGRTRPPAPRPTQRHDPHQSP